MLATAYLTRFEAKMLFGKIDYLNLLPFHIFLKGYPLQNATKKAIDFKKGVPSRLCRDLAFRRVDAAVISSIESRKYRVLDFGICARGGVKSVLVRKNSPKKLDAASMSSNMLAKILGVNGEIIIGDRALGAFLNEGAENFWDLSEIWGQKTGLPFVFGRFSFVKNKKTYEKIIKKFLNKKIKIPRYILNDYAKSRGIAAADILWYLNFIYYKMEAKEKMALKIFIREARARNFNPNGDFKVDK